MRLSNRTHTPTAHTLKGQGGQTPPKTGLKGPKVWSRTPPPLHHLSPVSQEREELEGKEGEKIKLHILTFFS